MRLAARGLLLLLTFIASASGAGDKVDGHWTVKYASGYAMLTIGSTEFDLKTEGNALTGKEMSARVGRAGGRSRTAKSTGIASHLPSSASCLFQERISPKWLFQGAYKAVR
jgi:hypothetical protein